MSLNEKDEPVIYPYCYKIKEDCPLKYDSDNCLDLLANYVVVFENIHTPQNEKDDVKLKLGNCLNQEIYTKK